MATNTVTTKVEYHDACGTACKELTPEQHAELRDTLWTRSKSLTPTRFYVFCPRCIVFTAR